MAVGTLAASFVSTLSQDHPKLERRLRTPFGIPRFDRFLESIDCLIDLVVFVEQEPSGVGVMRVR